ncbi:methylmalonyl-CoA mutase subunit beta [Antarcticibacterium sp. 1MA-6-2]|uniref:methylmalonyl-CoA mutase subunit beta n=1 Tax=Antarcticibacterium sp. 1MA-6-2 TaxID=2908210 RepID=UPI001F17D980|nr:methylmalonyl-CoA mutase subunit beta [Antarcticibacterium sp. 1MA-6-2]UJH92105.1 methylmalonyl-CoA mutase subunit beta [Antarcticibacterium sp. 1MA-6-2]
MSQPLFEEFEEISAKQWKQKIQFDLKGADYNKELIYKSRDGINIKPFYNSEDIKEPARVPSPQHWEICEKIYVASEEISNHRAKEVLKKGAESLWFVIPSDETRIEKLLKNIPVDQVKLYFSFLFLSEEYIKKLADFLPEKSTGVHLNLDIIGNLAKTGNWYANMQQDHQVLEKIIGNSEKFESVLSIDSTLYQNAGATIPQELAYSLAHANEYCNHFSNKEISTNLKFQFLVSTGANYFFEIAKVRALRLLFSSLASEYNLNDSCFILAQPTKRDKTLYDYNVNLLRTTMQSMSAVLGGADAVYNSPYDAIYHKNNEFGDRIARNQLLVLKNESYLDKVSNAAEGAYYIESLTTQFAEKALEIFKEIEKGGGFLKQLQEGVIQRKIEESVQKEQEQFDKGELVLIGTNKYPNPADKMKGELELFPFLKNKPRKTLIQPILERRLAEKYEQERLEKE